MANGENISLALQIRLFMKLQHEERIARLCIFTAFSSFELPVRVCECMCVRVCGVRANHA